MNSEDEARAALRRKTFDIEQYLLVEAIYRRYHYDFRGYAQASLKRRLQAALTRFSCRTLSQLQHLVLHEPEVFPAMLEYLTVQVSEMFRDPTYFRALRENRGAAAAHLSLAQGVGGGLQHRGRGVFARHPAARGGACWSAR